MFVPKKRRREYRSDWRESTGRDKSLLGFKCEKCGSAEGVQRHHIVSLNPTKHGGGIRGGGGADNLLNIMLLCTFCHLRAHRRYKRRK